MYSLFPNKSSFASLCYIYSCDIDVDHYVDPLGCYGRHGDLSDPF